MFVSAYFRERDRDGGPAWLGYVERLRDLYRGRRDAMLAALAEHFGEGARAGRHPQGGLFIWATLDERIDTTDLLALAQTSEGVAFVPGRAAYVDGRSGASSMRLNFAGVPEADIREGIRRIGRAMREQVGLLGSLTAPPPAAAGASADRRGARGRGGSALADVVALPRRDGAEQERRRRDR